ncbi:MAG: IS66 family insertion sequence element accessory protein TnpB [Bdellovibrionaceae bacterium]|nr:IS66 family insertion sequence element accessory protein TnpB [Pseudobdellovibrionaceae bacterium]
MKAIREFESIVIHKAPVDLRKSINGLSVIVSEELGLDLKSKSLFVFTNRRRSHMKKLTPRSLVSFIYGSIR